MDDLISRKAAIDAIAAHSAKAPFATVETAVRLISALPAALEPPTHAAQLAAALKLPEVAALVGALGMIETLTATGDGLDAYQTIRVHTIAHAAIRTGAKP